jgi:hypothetical protein
VYYFTICLVSSSVKQFKNHILHPVVTCTVNLIDVLFLFFVFVGKALCLLNRSDFMERIPRNGDVLYNVLQTLIQKNGKF